MHMSDALLSPVVGGVMAAASAGAVAWSVARMRKDDLDEKKIPTMGVMGAFVFAAQMINFTIPVTGSSGHIGGGILLAAMLGSHPAFLTLSAVLIIQALFFADGGLLALGANLFNLGFVTCLVAYPLIFRPILRKGITVRRITIASLLSVVVGLQLGSLGVVLETVASGITDLPFGAFAALMQPIHLAIGIVEGLVTAAVLSFVYKMRPEILESAESHTAIGKNVPIRNVLIGLLAAALLIGGGLSIFASANPDGLEWSIERIIGAAEPQNGSAAHDAASQVQESTALMPDYALPAGDSDNAAAGTSAAGILGGGITLAAAACIGFVITRFRRKSRKQT